MDGFLKVADDCTVCGQELHHHRADDGPTWATIMIVGHVIVPGMLAVYTRWQPEPMLMATGFCIAAVAMSLYLLPRLKGLFVAIQWANRMHGFGGAHVASCVVPKAENTARG